MRKSSFFSLLIVAFTFCLGTFLYGRLPATMATHWGINGTVNGYSAKPAGTFMLPGIMAVLWVVFLVAPMIDPKKKNIEVFRGAFDRFVILLFMFLEYLYLLTLAWNLGYQFDFLRYMLPSFAVIYFAVGDLVAHAEPNWTIGIRSPWTLSSDTVWRKTNRVAGTLFKYSAAVAMLTLPFPSYGIYFILAPGLATAIITLVYSYILYGREIAGQKHG